MSSSADPAALFARVSASGATQADLAACCADLLVAPASAWRLEGLRWLLARALAAGDRALAVAAAAGLPERVVAEEQLAAQAVSDPAGALAAAEAIQLSSAGWRRLQRAARSQLVSTSDPCRAAVLASALVAALDQLPPALAFLEAALLVTAFALTPAVDVTDLLALASSPAISPLARPDLYRAVAAALAARGADADAQVLGAEARQLSASEARPGERP